MGGKLENIKKLKLFLAKKEKEKKELIKLEKKTLIK